MLTIKDSTGKTVGVLKHGDNEPEMTANKGSCSCTKKERPNCTCTDKVKEKEQ